MTFTPSPSEVLTPPSTPTNLAVTTVLPRLVQLSWSASTDDTGVTGYTVLRDGTPLATVPGSARSYFDIDRSPGTTATYAVVATDGAGNGSGASDPLAITTPQPSTPVFEDDFESGDLGAWTSTSGLALQSAIVHSGAQALLGSTTAGNTYAKATLPTTFSDGYLRAWVDVPSASSTVNLLRFRTAAGDSIAYVYVTSSGALGFHDDLSGTNTISATHLDPASGWHALEVHLSINGSAGIAQVWLDGVPVDDLSSNVIDLGTTPIGGVQIGEVQSGRTYEVAFDDVAFDVNRIGP